MEKRNVLEINKESAETAVPSPHKGKKVVLVPPGFDGMCAAVPLSRIFGAFPLFLDTGDPVQASSVMNSVKESGCTPITAGISVLDDTFYGTEGISIEHSRGNPVRGRGIRACKHRTVIESSTISGALLRLFPGKLTIDDEKILLASKTLHQWLRGERVAPFGFIRSLWLAAAMEICPETLFAVLEKHPETLSSIPDEWTMTDTESQKVPETHDGIGDTVMKHLFRQWQISLRTPRKQIETAHGNVTVIKPHGSSATLLSANLAMLPLPWDRNSISPQPAVFCLPDGESKKKRFFVYAGDAEPSHFIKNGIEPAKKRDNYAIREVKFPSSKKLSMLVEAVSLVSKDSLAALDKKITIELGGIDKGI